MSSWHVQQLKFALGIGGFMSFYGVVGLITWFGGEKLGLGLNTRIVVILVIAATFPFTMLVSYLATRRSRQKEEAAKEPDKAAAEKTSEAPAAKTAATAAQIEGLPQGVEEVVKFLKTSNLGETGKDGVYTLPWYLVAGMPKAGKSSIVVGSNLNFQALPSQRQSELKLIRPTKDVDWRVTTDAVFVDTAGRLQTEDGNPDEWSAILETIRKNRSVRPIDGMLLIADADRILNSDERDIEEIAKVMRARLDEAMQRLKVRFPVYLIFSRADAIEGFRDSFSASKKEGETLVWGATIPLEKSENAHALFDEEFGLLNDSVMKRRLMRLSAPFPPVRQLRIFNFPLHFGSSRRKFATFVSALFRPNPFTENPFFRGFYFTAAPVGKQAQSEGPQPVGPTYFIEKLVRDVILRDKDLVRTFQEQRQRPPILGWALTLIGAAIVFVLLTMATVSAVTNYYLLDDASKRGLAVLNNIRADQNIDPRTKTPEASKAEIRAVENLRLLMKDLDDFERNGALFRLGMGLYSGNRIYREKLLPIFYNAMDRRFMKGTVERIEEQLKTFAASPPVKDPKNPTADEEDVFGKNYDLLKVYLMLTDEFKDRASGTDIENTLKDHWFAASKLDESNRADADNLLKFYAKQVDRLEGREKFPRIAPNVKLVSDVRAKLKVFPAEQRYYRRKVAEISKKIEASTVMSVDRILQAQSANQGIIEGKHTVPGAFTLQGFREMEKAILTSATELSACDWVVEGKCDATKTATEAVEAAAGGKIRERYFRDYTDQWKAFLRGLKVKPYRKEGASGGTETVTPKDALAELSLESSPIKIVLAEVARQTNLAAKPDLGWWDTIKNLFSPQSLPASGADSQVVRTFAPLHAFVETPKEKTKKSVIDTAYIAELGRLSTKYNELSADGKLGDAATRDKELNLGRVTADITKSTQTLSKEFPFLVEFLQQPVENLKVLFGADTVRQIAEKWKTEIVPVARKAEQGYPFEAGETNADFTNLREYLGNGKALMKFYDENLKRFFDGTPGQLKLKNPESAPFSPEFVDYLNKALLLRAALFSKGDDVKFTYNFELLNAKDAIVEMTIDGVKVSSAESTQSSQIDFPAPSGGGNGVTIKVLSTTETTSTSANPSPSPVSSPSPSSTPRPSTQSTTSGGGEKQFLGPWGLFRFMDDAGAKKESEKVYRLSYRLRNGKVVEAKVTAAGEDPFNREIYKLRAPENILK